jgi:hypothetical protein
MVRPGRVLSALIVGRPRVLTLFVLPALYVAVERRRARSRAPAVAEASGTG